MFTLSEVKKLDEQFKKIDKYFNVKEFFNREVCEYKREYDEIRVNKAFLFALYQENEKLFNSLGYKGSTIKIYVMAILHEYCHKLQYNKWKDLTIKVYYNTFKLLPEYNRTPEVYKSLYPERVADRFARKYVNFILNKVLNIKEG